MTTITTDKKRLYYIDVLNILACLSVIFMHCNGIVHFYDNSRAWKESMVVETLCYWAVPVFFMITGATLMEYRDRYDTGTYFKKRVLKTVFPFIIWSFLSLFYKICKGKLVFEWTLPNVLELFNNTTAENVYWFFIPLFMVYLAIPVMSLLKDNKNILLYMTGICFLINTVYPMACVALKIQYNGAFSFPAASGYMMFVLLGYLLSNTDFTRHQRWLFYGLALLVGCGVRYVTTVLWSVRNGALDRTFWGYFNFPAVFLAIGVFIFIKYLPLDPFLENKTVRKWLAKISGAGFGVYLMHMLVYQVLLEHTMLEESSYAWRFLIPFVIYFVCVSLVLLLKKIPVLRNIVP